jgi:putative Holliday junction resolvase
VPQATPDRPACGPSGAAETVLSFDFGTRRIGVAVGNSIAGSARPLAIVEEAAADRRFARIEALIREWQPQRLVVGLPLNEDGSPVPNTARAHRFARQLEGRYRLPVAMVDERFSTAAALECRGAREPEDAEAAAIILRQYFDEHDQP